MYELVLLSGEEICIANVLSMCLYHGQEFLVSFLNKSWEHPTVTASLKSRCSPAFVRSAMPCSRCALLNSKDCECQAEAPSTGRRRPGDSSWSKPSQKQPGGQTDSGLEGKVGSTLSGPAGVVCGTSPVRAGLVCHFVVLSFLHSSAAFAESLNFSQGMWFPPSSEIQTAYKNGFFWREQPSLLWFKGKVKGLSIKNSPG